MTAKNTSEPEVRRCTASRSEEVLLSNLGAVANCEDARHRSIKYWLPSKAVKSYSYEWVDPNVWDEQGRLTHSGTIKVTYFKNKSGEYQA